MAIAPYPTISEIVGLRNHQCLIVLEEQRKLILWLKKLMKQHLLKYPLKELPKVPYQLIKRLKSSEENCSTVFKLAYLKLHYGNTSSHDLLTSWGCETAFGGATITKGDDKVGNFSHQVWLFSYDRMTVLYSQLPSNVFSYLWVNIFVVAKWAWLLSFIKCHFIISSCSCI